MWNFSCESKHGIKIQKVLIIKNKNMTLDSLKTRTKKIKIKPETSKAASIMILCPINCHKNIYLLKMKQETIPCY